MNRGVNALSARGLLSLRHGVHVGSVPIAGGRGVAGKPIVIRSPPGEHACIDGAWNFRRRFDDDWVPARSVDPGAVNDEYVSAATP